MKYKYEEENIPKDLRMLVVFIAKPIFFTFSYI